MSESLREQLIEAARTCPTFRTHRPMVATDESRDTDHVAVEEFVDAILPLIEAYGDSRAAEGRRAAADAVSEYRDETLAKLGTDDSATARALKALANDWLTHARAAARGPFWSSEVVRVARQNIDNAQKRTGQ